MFNNKIFIYIFLALQTWNMGEMLFTGRFISLILYYPVIGAVLWLAMKFIGEDEPKIEKMIVAWYPALLSNKINK